MLAPLLAAPLRAAPPAAAPTLGLDVGNSGGINAIAYSPDGKAFASGAGDETARLWDVASGQLKAILNGVFAFVFSPDSRSLATVGDDGVRLRDAGNGQLKVALANTYGAAAFSPDGQTLATGGAADDGNLAVLLWDAASGRLKATLEPGLRHLAGLSFSSDGQTLAASGSYWGPEMQVWDVGAGFPKRVLTGRLDRSLSPPTARRWRPRAWTTTGTASWSSGTWRASTFGRPSGGINTISLPWPSLPTAGRWRRGARMTRRGCGTWRAGN
jgi:WD40 repeat protein